MVTIPVADISEFQGGNINYPLLKTAVSAVMIRSTYGTKHLDSQYTHNKDTARTNNLPLGLYHYAYPKLNTPEAEAQDFCNAVADLRIGEVLALDFEEAYDGDHVDWCFRFLEYCKDYFNNRVKPLLYINLSEANAHDWSKVIDADYGLWIANWDHSTTAIPVTKWKVTAMKQYSASENVAGIDPIDMNVFFGDVVTFQRYGLTAIPEPIPTPEPSTPDPIPTPVPEPLPNGPAPTNPIPTGPIPVKKTWFQRLIDEIIGFLRNLAKIG